MDFSILLSSGFVVFVIALMVVVLALGKGESVPEVITEAQRLANLMLEVASHVKAAEMILGDKTGPEKMAWVLEQLQDLFPTMNIGYLRTKVEAAVHDMNSGAGVVNGEITLVEPGEVTASRAAGIL